MAIHKLRALEYLICVVEQGSFAAAARSLGVAPPSVHRLIGALERELGVPLLDRDISPLAPTPEARRYLERARALVEELGGLEAGLRDHAHAPMGTVTLAAQSVVSQFVLTEALPAFHEQYPSVRVDLRDAGISRDLTRMGVDVLMQFGWPPLQDAIVRTLAHTRWLIVAAPSFWKRHGVPVHPSDLSRLPCAVYRVPYGEVLNTWTFRRGDEQVAVRVDGWLIGDERNALDAPVFAGQMAARVNDFSGVQALRDGRLRAVLLDWVGQHSPPLNLLLRRTHARQPRVRALVDFMAAWAQDASRNRLPAGMPPVAPAKRPDWFRKRVA